MKRRRKRSVVRRWESAAKSVGVVEIAVAFAAVSLGGAHGFAHVTETGRMGSGLAVAQTAEGGWSSAFALGQSFQLNSVIRPRARPGRAAHR